MEYRIKYLFEKRIGGAWGDEPNSDGTVCLRAADIVTDEMNHKTNDLTYRNFSEIELKTRSLQAGDLIIEKSGGGENQPVGRVAKFILGETALCSNFLELLRPDALLANTDYLGYLLYDLWARNIVVRSIKQTTGIQNLDSEHYFDNKIELPSLDQQAKIVDYLDTELGKIDGLIAQKRALLELLDEKRKVIISQAVTRGIDPKTRLKDSGIEWMGEISGNWEVYSLKYLTNEPLKYGANEAALEENKEDPRFIRITDIDEKGMLKDETFKSISPEIAADYLLKHGDILFARSGATVGKSFLYKEEWGVAAYAGYLIKMSCDTSMILPEYMYVFTQSQLYWLQIDLDSIQATIQNFSGEKYANIKVPLPSKEEQKDILNYLDKEQHRYESIFSKTETSIRLLQEKRIALISSVLEGDTPV